MKPLNLIVLLFLLFSLSSCADDDSYDQQPHQEIENLIQSNNFIITSFIDSGSDETSHFSCYSFIFNTDGTLSANNGINTYSGSWNISDSNSNDDSSDDLDFNINFSMTDELEELNEDWDIVSYNSNSISLIHISGGNGGTDNLIFEIGSPAENCSSQVSNTVQTNIQAGTWRITSFIDSGDDETNHFSGYNFTFEETGILTANNGSNNFQGTWSISDNNSNDDSIDDLDFNINFNSPSDFTDLNDDWEFISHSSTKIELIDISGGNGGTDYLTFEKN